MDIQDDTLMQLEMQIPQKAQKEKANEEEGGRHWSKPSTCHSRSTRVSACADRTAKKRGTLLRKRWT